MQSAVSCAGLALKSLAMEARLEPQVDAMSHWLHVHVCRHVNMDMKPAYYVICTVTAGNDAVK
jgi:hypothetical protein